MQVAHFPRHKVETVELRKKDIVIRVTDWWRDKEEPAFDVEVYTEGCFDYERSHIFAKSDGLSKEEAKAKAKEFAKEALDRLMS